MILAGCGTAWDGYRPCQRVRSQGMANEKTAVFFRAGHRQSDSDARPDSADTAPAVSHPGSGTFRAPSAWCPSTSSPRSQRQADHRSAAGRLRRIKDSVPQQIRYFSSPVLRQTRRRLTRRLRTARWGRRKTAVSACVSDPARPRPPARICGPIPAALRGGDRLRLRRGRRKRRAEAQNRTGGLRPPPVVKIQLCTSSARLASADGSPFAAWCSRSWRRPRRSTLVRSST